MKRFLLFLLICSSLGAMPLHRVIVSCDTNPLYSDFWPMVAKAWQKFGVRPTLALIAPKDFVIDETLGDVIRFEPIPGVSVAFYSQAIRLLLPLYFEDEVCLISDMDMLPLQRDYFVNSIAPFSEDKFIVFRDGAFDTNYFKEYPMCYIAAYGRVYKKLFKINSIEEIPARIKEWHTLGLGWTADQQILYYCLNNWELKDTCMVKLGHNTDPRIDRLYWTYNKELLKKGFYIDSHMLRPYSSYKKQIDELVQDLGLTI